MRSMLFAVTAASAALLISDPAAAACSKTVYGSSPQAQERAQQEYLLCQQRDLGVTIQDTKRDAQWDSEIQALQQQLRETQRRVETPIFPSPDTPAF